MISRDLILNITDTNVSLDKTIVLYRYDRGITFNITLQSNTYDLEKEIVKARAIILRPNKKVSATPIDDIVKEAEGNVIKCVYVLYLDDTWTDHLGEIGKYQIQLQLYSDNPNDECITIAPFSFEVKSPIGIPQDSAAYVDLATADNYNVSYAVDLPTGDLDNGEYLETKWIGGDLITSGKLNKIESVIDYLVGESANHVDEEYVNEAISNIDIPDVPEVDLSDYATKEELGAIENAANEIGTDLIDFATYADTNYATKNELSDYALKTDIPDKTSQLTNDSGFLTKHQSLKGYATESYVQNAIEEAQFGEGGGSNLNIMSIGSDDPNNPYYLTGYEFTEEQYSISQEITALFNNVFIGGNYYPNDLVKIYLGGFDDYNRYLMVAKLDGGMIAEYALGSDGNVVINNQFSLVPSNQFDEFTSYVVNDLIGNINALLDTINGEDI